MFKNRAKTNAKYFIEKTPKPKAKQKLSSLIRGILKNKLKEV